MSWVEKTAGGRHRAAYRDGTGRRHSRIFVRKADAKTWLAAADADRARGLWVDPRGGALPFRDWAETWFATRTVRPTTSAGDHGRYNNHLQPAFGDLPLKDLTPMRIRTFVSELSGRRAPGTVRHVHALLSTMLRDAVEEGLLLMNPCRKTALPAGAALRRGLPVVRAAADAAGRGRPVLPLPGADRRGHRDALG